jgi:hypothetical protein
MEWGKLHITRSFIICAKHNLTIIKSRRMRLAGQMARMGEKRKVLVGKPEGKH